MSAVQLPQCLGLTDADEFKRTLAGALRALPPGTLPLQAGCFQGGWADDRDIAVTVLSASQAPDRITARVGVFFTELVGGCNCHDDPLEANGYCVLAVAIDRHSGAATIRVAAG
jgi:hypothetical protein